MIAHVRRFDVVISKSWIPCFGWNAQLLNHDSRRKKRKYQCTLNWVSACLNYSNAKAWKGTGSYRNFLFKFRRKKTRSHTTRRLSRQFDVSLKIKSSTSLHHSIIAHLFKKKLNKENTLGFFEVHRSFEVDLHISTLTITHRPSPARLKGSERWISVVCPITPSRAGQTILEEHTWICKDVINGNLSTFMVGCGYLWLVVVTCGWLWLGMTGWVW